MGTFHRKTALALILAGAILPLSLEAYDNGVAPGTEIPVLSGGIGDDMDSLRSVQHEYNLKLLFTEANGMYLADVPVRIRDRQGNEVLNTVADGPVMLVKLPPGTYTITASAENEVKDGRVSVGHSSLNTYQFRFPTRDDEE